MQTPPPLWVGGRRMDGQELLVLIEVSLGSRLPSGLYQKKNVEMDVGSVKAVSYTILVLSSRK